jgi:hypothetical protein
MNAIYEEIGEDAPTVQYVGAYMATVTARCLKCSYEADWNLMKKDRLGDSKELWDACLRPSR